MFQSPMANWDAVTASSTSGALSSTCPVEHAPCCHREEPNRRMSFPVAASPGTATAAANGLGLIYAATTRTKYIRPFCTFFVLSGAASGTRRMSALILACGVAQGVRSEPLPALARGQGM